MPCRIPAAPFALLLTTAAPAAAQIPAQLLGTWEMRQVAFVASQAVPPDLLARMDNPEVADLNREMAAGGAHLLVEFRADGTYTFTVTRPGQPTQQETGTYAVQNGLLTARSPATAGGSSFDQQRLAQLSRRKLVVEFLVGEDLPGITEEVEYKRVSQ